MISTARWINNKATRSLHPEQVEIALTELAQRLGDSLPALLSQFPLGEDALIHLLAVSTICAQRLERDPEILQWLARPEISASDRGPRRMAAELRSGSRIVSENNFDVLRQWRAREMTRIALREIACASPLEQTTAELSFLADISVDTVYQESVAQLRARFGQPATEFAVFGLGKLGGRELNHSSDIDLLFVYAQEGSLSARLSYHQWHNRLAEQILKPFSEGGLYRVDLRLRPEGSAGPLTRSLESMEHYYSGFGETWERLALIKARRVCGSEELGYEFVRQHQTFVFPKSPTPELLDEIAAIKRRIEREVPPEQLNVKLGVGGIREIEFVVQTLQFIHGARHAFLQEPSTLKALRALAELELLPIAQIAALDQAYRFLRRVEHRLQIEAEQQTHSIPDDLTKRERLARSLGFASADVLLKELRSNTERVREIFQGLIASDGAPPAVRLDIFADQARAGRALNELAQGSSSFHVAPRTRQIFRKLRPLLLEQLAGCADPDAALIAMVRFVEAFGLRSLLFELLAANPKLLELLVKTFDASAFATDLLIRHPQSLEEITRSPNIGRQFSVADYRARLEALPGGTSADGIRAFRQTQLLRIIIRDLIGVADLHTCVHEISALAEACLMATHSLVADTDLTLVAMGKFGGRELTYGSDLDLMFVGQNHRAAQNLLGLLAAPSPAGVIASVDARLRPEGEKGPLVSPLEAFENYYRDRAQLWEIQALTRARPVAGPEQNEFRAVAHAAWSIAGRDPQLFGKIDEMLQRIRRERGGDDVREFKTGTGGIVEVEFLVQALQMHYDIREPSTFAAIAKLAPIISKTDARTLSDAYEFLRRIEAVLRRQQNTSVSTLPAEPGEQRKLALRLGLTDQQSWRAALDNARTNVHRVYLTHMRC